VEQFMSRFVKEDIQRAPFSSGLENSARLALNGWFWLGSRAALTLDDQGWLLGAIGLRDVARAHAWAGFGHGPRARRRHA
jgi:hypothetical protein